MMRKLLLALATVIVSAGAAYAEYSGPPVPVPVSTTNGGTGLAGTLTGARKANGASADTQAACADLANGAAGCSAAAGQYPGVSSNTPASAGNIGQDITNSATAQSVTNNTPLNITSVSLTAGEWTCWGNTINNPATSTVVSNYLAWISSTSATIPALPLYAQDARTNAATTVTSLIPPTTSFSLSGTTTVYLSAQISFTTSTDTISGYIECRRQH